MKSLNFGHGLRDDDPQAEGMDGDAIPIREYGGDTAGGRDHDRISHPGRRVAPERFRRTGHDGYFQVAACRPTGPRGREPPCDQRNRPACLVRRPPYPFRGTRARRPQAGGVHCQISRPSPFTRHRPRRTRTASDMGPVLLSAESARAARRTRPRRQASSRRRGRDSDSRPCRRRRPYRSPPEPDDGGGKGDALVGGQAARRPHPHG